MLFQMEAVREAYADMRSTVEAAQAQLSDLQAAEKGLQEQLSVCAQQVSHTCPICPISSAGCFCCECQLVLASTG